MVQTVQINLEATIMVNGHALDTAIPMIAICDHTFSGGLELESLLLDCGVYDHKNKRYVENWQSADKLEHRCFFEDAQRQLKSGKHDPDADEYRSAMRDGEIEAREAFRRAV